MEGLKNNIYVQGVSGVDFILYVSAEATDQCVENVAGQVNCFNIAGTLYKGYDCSSVRKCDFCFWRSNEPVC